MGEIIPECQRNAEFFCFFLIVSKCDLPTFIAAISSYLWDLTTGISGERPRVGNRSRTERGVSSTPNFFLMRCATILDVHRSAGYPAATALFSKIQKKNKVLQQVGWNDQNLSKTTNEKNKWKEIYIKLIMPIFKPMIQRWAVDTIRRGYMDSGNTTFDCLHCSQANVKDRIDWNFTHNGVIQ